MKIDLRGRSFLTLMDFSTEEIRYMLDLAHKLKAKKKYFVRVRSYVKLDGKTLYGTWSTIKKVKTK